LLGIKFVQIVILWIVFDTILGCLRAVKHHKFNSAFGIDGGIRKVAMIVSVAFLMLVDLMVGVNVISWLPDALRQAVGLTKNRRWRIFLYSLYFIRIGKHPEKSVLMRLPNSEMVENMAGEVPRGYDRGVRS